MAKHLRWARHAHRHVERSSPLPDLHDHDPYADDHHHDNEVVPLDQNALWRQDNVVLHSVGIDIGSSGTQVVFSRLHLRRLSEDLVARYVVVQRETDFESEIFLTPYLDDGRIHADELGAMLDSAYHAAKVDAGVVDTGAVILTGEALRQHNAEQIASLVSELAGDLVCATAGHHMEAMLAAHGSGAVRASLEAGERLLNIDIGGGTTKLALVENGRILQTAAFHLGGRLQVVEGGVIVRLDPAGRAHAAHAGFDWAVGDRIEPALLDVVAEGMAEAVIEAVSGRPLSDRVRALFLTDPIDEMGAVDAVTFSGGVAEHVYGLENRDFGDLGRRLGVALRARAADGQLPAELRPSDARIRATVLGASQYSVQLSGNTCYLTDPDGSLPRRNLKVVRPDYMLDEIVDSEAVAQSIERHLTSFDAVDVDEDVALALTWHGDPEYTRLKAYAAGIVAGIADLLRAGRTVYLMITADIARILGLIMREELGIVNDLVVLDGLDLHDFEFVDLGRTRIPSGTIPVTIKSLVFHKRPMPDLPDVGEPGGERP